MHGKWCVSTLISGPRAGNQRENWFRIPQSAMSDYPERNAPVRRRPEAIANQVPPNQADAFQASGRAEGRSVRKPDPHLPNSVPRFVKSKPRARLYRPLGISG
jgi:hypothetical protein